jgi:hypothetical protein
MKFQIQIKNRGKVGLNFAKQFESSFGCVDGKKMSFLPFSKVVAYTLAFRRKQTMHKTKFLVLVMFQIMISLKIWNRTKSF